MESFILSFNPVLTLIAIILTFMAAFTSLDLLTHMHHTKRNKGFLFWGGVSSISIGMWMMNYFGILAINIEYSLDQRLVVSIISMVAGFFLAVIAFYFITDGVQKQHRLLIGSGFLTIAIFISNILGLYSANLGATYHYPILIVSIIIVYALVYLSFWALFFSKISSQDLAWYKPLASSILTSGIVLAFFLLVKSLYYGKVDGISQNVNKLPFSSIVYLFLFLMLVIVGSLIFTKMMTSKKNANEITENHLKDTLKELSDIKSALDQAAIVAITDEKGIITSVNDTLCQISKYSRDELIGQNHSILNSGYHSREFFKELWKTIHAGDVWKGEIRNKAKDGSFYWVDTTIVPFVDKNGKIYQYLAIRNDITERKRTEEIISRQEKLSVLGQMAAGVAHEIRNPLTSMRGYTEFLILDETSSERQEYLEIIIDEIERVNTIVEDFMQLAKPMNYQFQAKPVMSIILSTLDLLEIEASKKNVQFELKTVDEPLWIKCEEDRIKQVFLNIMKNGIEAMPNGGDLSIRISKIEDHVQLSFTDTGKGIPQDQLLKIGEPFFTTKKMGNGLGMMVSFKIVEGHGGQIRIQSEVGKGSTFILTFPLIQP
ncbi:ATP-binding protein [Peribacillus alkalitolerans]|uniref:ATP-binding protein n=1 Tax=Peribacillus alkalitolerans TaxID=1550385 RepID=UPI0013D19F4B|nr:ATP-binding protein [Peribacillus alkalitolerans]